MDRMTEDRLTRVVAALAAAFTPNQAEVVAALRDLATFVPESCAFAKDRRKNQYYERGDEKCPLMSESYLYNLLGKEDARSVLNRFRRVCAALGVNEDDLHEAQK